MRDQGLGSWPARRARKTPHRTALVFEGEALDYAGLHARTARLAHALRTAGVRRGDRVAYLGPNHPAFLETLFATAALGAVFVPLNARLAEPEIAYQLADSGARLLVHAPSHAGFGADVAARVEVGPDYEAFLASGGDADPPDEPVALDDPFIIMYTSGTTGRPKGAVLTHGNITWNAVNVLVDTDVAADEVALVSAPLFHTAGLNMLAMPVLLKGGACVIVPAFDAEGTLDLIERHRVTFMFGVPTMFQQVARSPRFAEADLSSVRTLSCGGSPVPPSLIETYAARGLLFLQGYGMTEAAPGVLFLDAEHAVSKAGSAGLPHFFTDVKVAGDPGEVLVSGPNVMRGYWNLPGATAEALRDGWFHSGDAARVDADGYVTIVDRIKDMIISGGENVYPAEVEQVLAAHPDVLDCAVIGVPDAIWGEVGRAVVVLRPGAGATAEELLGALGGRLAKYKIPKSVVFADALPRNPSGKLLRAPIRHDHG
ncbi:acyl-CoA synthetase [Actinomadura parmotrematis]|uniref:Long-chain fatty acid--CoA ligase n=1 Tax=Actinomadura parmotrematis TaxID=2864039 RepID=A0ABS7G4W4_9ACTN|nr:long-chain fatty acid--CoA ligase [Actinomadura parmotrematis]MBW8487511.1 long-chain fatty acid--CoA ligase [Actinomadura parmotrematis]